MTINYKGWFYYLFEVYIYYVFVQLLYGQYNVFNILCIVWMMKMEISKETSQTKSNNSPFNITYIYGEYRTIDHIQLHEHNLLWHELNLYRKAITTRFHNSP